MIGWLIFLAVLLLVLWTPCGIYARYSSAGSAAELIIGPLRINLIGSHKKKGKKTKQNKFESNASVKSKKKISDFGPIANLIFDFLSDFRRRLRINDLQFKLILAGSDPCDLSIRFGRYWAVLGHLMPRLESWFTIRKRKLEIECDYLAESTKFDASIDLRVSLFTLLHMVLHHGIRIFTKFYKISKEAKDGAVS